MAPTTRKAPMRAAVLDLIVKPMIQVTRLDTGHALVLNLDRRILVALLKTASAAR